MKIYIDNCCYNRPFDDQRQPRIREETDAIAAIIIRAETIGDIILGSDVLLFEIGKIKDANKRAEIFSTFNRYVKEKLSADEKIFRRANEIMSVSNVKQMDALHLASTEFGDADIFLTTDDKLIRACKNLSLRMKVCNPVSYQMEAIKNDEH